MSNARQADTVTDFGRSPPPPLRESAAPPAAANSLEEGLIADSTAKAAAPAARQGTNDFTDVNDEEVSSGRLWAQQQKADAAAAQGKALHERVDVAHKLFLYVSIPMTVIVCVLAIVLYSIHKVEAQDASTAVAAFCAISAVILSLFLVYCHLTAYTNPDVQRLICRILFMVPIYSIDSLVALKAYKYGNLVGLVRDTYEAYVIYMFFNLMMKLLGGEAMCLSLWQTRAPSADEPATMKHLFPMSLCMKPMPLNEDTLTTWKLCLTQYMILNPLLTCLTIPLYFAEYYKDGDFSPDGTYVYFAFIRFWSVTFAFTSLVYFFLSTKDFLEPHKPLYKFAAVKAVVFLSFWQSVVLAGLNHFKVIPHTSLWTADEVTTGMQNFVVCIEMYLAALAHRWVFSDETYLPETGRTSLKRWAVAHMLSISDVVEEAKLVLRITPKNAPRAAATSEASLYTQDDFRSAQ